MKAIIFTAFVIAALLLYCAFWYSDPRNVESYPVPYELETFHNPY